MMTRAEALTREPNVGTTPMRLPSDQDASGRTLGAAELARLEAVITSGTLTATKGAQTPELESRFAARLGRAAAIACSSGTAAVHAAIAAIDPEPGDEVVTSPITDMGAIAPILFHGAIPRFADVDPATGMVTPETVAAATSTRTRAVVVTHLFGVPAPVDDIVVAAGGLPVVEDCAQAYGAARRGRLVGTIGTFGCFSLQQGKHITAGEGGVLVGDDPQLLRRARLFVNKAWPYGEADPDHEFLALNLRISELQSAVANAQLERLDAAVDSRRATAAAFVDAIRELPGLQVTPVPEGDLATWWKVPLLVDPAVVPGGPGALATELAELGIASAPRYIQKPAFACRVFTEQRTFGASRWPFTLATPEALDYSLLRFPGTHRYLDRVLVLPWNERYEAEHVDLVAGALTTALRSLGVTA
jgi:dTDP-4-amino-4,6-dideoxygalactose transaminase